MFGITGDGILTLGTEIDGGDRGIIVLTIKFLGIKDLLIIKVTTLYGTAVGIAMYLTLMDTETQEI
tara:strand:- start:197 stop:394 length:198 start_codon:yes stop_codon:yes gene_type:complete